MGKFDLGKYKDKYKRIKLKAEGRPTLYSANNADAVSRSMLCMTKEDIIETAKANRLGTRLASHFAKNSGMVRMIVGQALRSELLKGRSVVIGGNKIDTLNQRVEWPFGYVECERLPEGENPFRRYK